MYITKKNKNFEMLKNIRSISTIYTTFTVNISQILWFNFPLNSFIVWIFLIDEELRPRRNDLTSGRNALVPFLKLYGIAFSLQ